MVSARELPSPAPRTGHPSCSAHSHSLPSGFEPDPFGGRRLSAVLAQSQELEELRNNCPHDSWRASIPLSFSGDLDKLSYNKHNVVGAAKRAWGLTAPAALVEVRAISS